MSVESARRWIWIASLIVMPVPFYLAEVEWAPVIRLGFLSSLFGLVALAEGGMKVAALAGMGLLQLLTYVGLFWLGAGLLAQLFGRITSPPLRVAAVGTLIFLLVTSSLLPIYETPLSSTRLRSSLWHVFD